MCGRADWHILVTWRLRHRCDCRVFSRGRRRPGREVPSTRSAHDALFTPKSSLCANGKSTFLNALLAAQVIITAPRRSETFIASKGEHHPNRILPDCGGARFLKALRPGRKRPLGTKPDQGTNWRENKSRSPVYAEGISSNLPLRSSLLSLEITNRACVLLTKPMRRRFNLIPLHSHYFRLLSAKRRCPDGLKAEWPCILAWMIDGCLDLKKPRKSCAPPSCRRMPPPWIPGKRRYVPGVARRMHRP